MLTSQERRTTAAELHANLDLAGLDASAVAALVDRSAAQVRLALDVADGCDPALVWAVRDAVESAVVDKELEPVQFTVLTEQSRGSARRWFGVGPRPSR